MKHIFIWILTGLCTVPCINVLPQADIYMALNGYNRANFNPAFITRKDYMYLFLNARNQWLGVDGSPQVFQIQASEYYDRIHSAFGISFIHDRIGLTRRLQPMLTYAYRIDKGIQDYSLSLGFSVGLVSTSMNGQNFEAEVMNDPAISYIKEKSCQPDANIGFEFQSPHFILGLSSTHLFSSEGSGNAPAYNNHRYGYFVYKNNNLNFLSYKIGLHLVNRSNITVLEGSLFLRFKHQTGLLKGPSEFLDLGIAYRTSHQMVFIIGLMMTTDVRLAYAYDQSLNRGYYMNGTHEIMLEYRIPDRVFSKKTVCY